MEAIHFLAINLSCLICLRFRWLCSLTFPLWWQISESRHFFRAVSHPSLTYMVLPFEWQTHVQTVAGTLTQSASWLSFDLLLLPLSSTEKIPVILYEQEITCWPPPWTSLGWPLSFVESDEGVLWSSSPRRSMASSLSFGLPVCKGSQHSFFHDTQSRNWTGKKEH